MEKGNKTNSAFVNKSNIFYRQNGRLALRTFLENLRENGDAKAENKQITQCVFLGALCLKPVPDIFQVALQPYTFKTRNRAVVLNDVQTLNHHRPARKQSRKNTRRSTSCAPKNSNSSRILELFDNTHLTNLRLTSQSSTHSNESALENAVPIEKHVKNTRKMDVKTKQLPLLVPVKEMIDLETKNCNIQKLEPILIELDEDDIEDYLEVDQHVVADLEALIPDEEIEFISNSLINPKQFQEADDSRIEEIKTDENGVSECKPEDEPKVNEILETIAINEVVSESPEKSVKITTKSRKITEFLKPQVENIVTTVVEKRKDLIIEIPDEKKEYEIRTLRSGVKVSPPYSQSIRSKKSQIPKLIPVKNKETSKENNIIEKVQNEANLQAVPNRDKEEPIIVDDDHRNEEIKEKLPIPTIVLEDNVKEEEPVEIQIENKQTEVTEKIEDTSKNIRYEGTSNILEKMMKNRGKKTTPKTKKQRKTRLTPKKRGKTKKLIEDIIQTENINTKLPENENKSTNAVAPIKNEDRVEIIEDQIEKLIHENKVEETSGDKVEEIINDAIKSTNETTEEKPKEINIQENNNEEPKKGLKKRKNKQKKTEKTKNTEIKTRTKKKKTKIRNNTTELNLVLNDVNNKNHLPDKETPTNNNESIETKQTKRLSEEKTNSSRKKRKTKEEDTSISSPESCSELSLENKDPEMTKSETQLEPEDQMEYPSKEPYRRIYRCRVCLLVFETYNKLKAHKTVHDVKNPYQCQECGKSYDDVEELAAHLRIHKGKMPYPCKKCDSSFWTSVQLERHQLVHVLKKVPPPNNTAPKRIFKCEECGKEFKKICDLERHTRVHTGEKPSVCNICNKRFQQAYNLNKHLLIHTQEKNFECIICQKKFGRNDVLNRHVLTHSIDKPFHCSICSKTFIRNTQLNLHIRKHHGIKADPKKAENSGAGKSSD